MDEAGKPLPGAPVSIAAGREGLPDPRLVLLRGQTDEDGRWVLALDELERARAQAGDGHPLAFFAALELPIPDAPRVELARELAGTTASLVAPGECAALVQPLRVRVVDAGGAPVGGVGISLRVRRESDRERELDDLLIPYDETGGFIEPPPCAPAVTRAGDGRVDFALDSELELRRKWPTSRIVRRLELWAPFAELPRLELGLELPDDVVTFALPMCGALEAELEPGSAPLAGVRLQILAPCFRGPCPYLEAPFADGRVRIPAVGLGLALDVRALAAGRRPPPFVHLLGPTRAGETVSVRLAPGSEWPRATLRVVDERGDALAAETFAGWIDGPFPPPQIDGPLRSDEQGRVTLSVPGDPAPGERRVLVLRPRRNPVLDVRVSLPAELASGVVIDLGSAVLDLSSLRTPEPVQRLLSGTVWSDDGQPIGMANVVLRPSGPHADHSARTGPDGRFVVEGRPLEERGVLFVQAPGFVPSQQELDVGASDVRIVLQRAACFEARFLLDDESLRPELDYTLTGPATVYGLLEEHAQRCDLVPGVYALEIRGSHGGIELGLALARIDALQLAPGSSSGDARLMPFDLRGRLTRLRLTLSGRSGLPLGRLTLRFAGESAVVRGPVVGRLDCIVPTGVEIELQPEGFRPLRVWPGSAGEELVFDPVDPR